MAGGTRLLAFFRRLMDAAERTTTWHLLRGGAAVLMAMAVAVFVASQDADDAPGRTLLATVVWVNGCVLLVGVTGLFGSLVAEERTAGTLPLLKLTGNSEAAILLGLAGPKLLLLTTLLLLQLPFAILSTTLGGVTPEQALGCYSTLALSGLLWSAVVTLAACLTRTASAAVFLTVGVGATAAAGLPTTTFEWLFPVNVLGEILDDTRSLPPARFVVGILGGTAGVALVSLWAFRRTALSVATVGAFRTEKTWRLFAGAFGRSRIPANPTQRGPHAWKSFEFVAGGRAGWYFRVFVYVMTGVVVWSVGWLGGSRISLPMTVAIVSGLMVPVDVAWLAARRVRLEIEADAWDTLALLPTTYAETIGGTTDGTVRGTTAGILVLSVATLVEAARHDVVLIYVVAAVGIGVFLACYGPLLAICWSVGTWMALRMPATYAAAATGVAIVLTGAGLVFAMRVAGVIGALVLSALLPVMFVWLCASAGRSDQLLRRFMTGIDQVPLWMSYRAASQAVAASRSSHGLPTKPRPSA